VVKEFFIVESEAAIPPGIEVIGQYLLDGWIHVILALLGF
jgi:hypothetical protein